MLFDIKKKKLKEKIRFLFLKLLYDLLKKIIIIFFKN